MKFKGILLLTDMDGTLLADDVSMGQDNYDALTDFIQNGGSLAYASGRPADSLLSYCAILPATHPMIAYNGAVFADQKTCEALVSMPLEIASLTPLFAVADRHPKVSLEFLRMHDFLAYHPNDYTEIHAKAIGHSYTTITSPTELEGCFLKAAFWGPEEDVLVCMKDVKDNLSPGTHCLRGHRYNCEVSNMLADKGSFIDTYRKSYDDIQYICSIGDNENDVGMLKNADFSMTPADAFPVAKEACTLVLRTPYKEGVMREAIHAIAEHYKLN